MMSCTLPLPIPVPLTALHADYPPIHLGVKVSNDNSKFHNYGFLLPTLPGSWMSLINHSFASPFIYTLINTIMSIRRVIIHAENFQYYLFG